MNLTDSFNQSTYSVGTKYCSNNFIGVFIYKDERSDAIYRLALKSLMPQRIPKCKEIFQKR